MSETAIAAGLYEIPQEMRDFRETIRQIVDERVRPRAAEIDRTGEYPQDIRELFGSHDILGLPFPAEYGGTGTGTLMLQIAVEEIAKACASSALILMIQELGSSAATSKSRSGCRGWRPERSLQRSRCPSPRPAPIPPRCERSPSRTATSG
jgi:alkylation response protein AidB-like acyl-CoA dehydrogenase